MKHLALAAMIGLSSSPALGWGMLGMEGDDGRKWTMITENSTMLQSDQRIDASLVVGCNDADKMTFVGIIYEEIMYAVGDVDSWSVEMDLHLGAADPEAVTATVMRYDDRTVAIFNHEDISQSLYGLNTVTVRYPTLNYGTFIHDFNMQGYGDLLDSLVHACNIN